VTAKKFALLLVLAATVLAIALVPSIALANMGPHGGYISNTEACAGCHRAHTAPSSVTWTDRQNFTRSALLLSSASTVEEFCLACHDNASQGANTNVVDGVYEGTVNGTPGAALLSGPFGRADTVGGVPGFYANGKMVTSTHIASGASWGAYGGGAFGSTSSVDATGNGLNPGFGNQVIVMDCGTCHDPHGSSNYRILKDTVYGVAVGGYDPNAPGASAATPTPTPFVISKEVGFPTGGFALHTQYSAYVPNYTKAQYSVAPGADPLKGMSGWCSGCHTTYMTQSSVYNANDGYGFVTRHRHPINVALNTFQGPRDLVVTDTVLPFDHVSTDTSGAVTNTAADWIDCLTCHNAHGASSVMTGWANVADSTNPAPNTGTKGGVDPAMDSALLKLDNRGVCEACHNK
jgi:predicted CXXCH cytochrome family protein